MWWRRIVSKSAIDGGGGQGDGAGQKNESRREMHSRIAADIGYVERVNLTDVGRKIDSGTKKTRWRFGTLMCC